MKIGRDAGGSGGGGGLRKCRPHGNCGSLLLKAAITLVMFSVRSSENNISGCEHMLVLPLRSMLGSVQHYASCYYDWLTAAFLPSLPALTQTSMAEVMPGSQAKNPRSMQGYAVKSKFRRLLSGVCNSSINQTG